MLQRVLIHSLLCWGVLAITLPARAQFNNRYIQEKLASVSSPLSLLQELEQKGRREIGDPALDSVAIWLEKWYAQEGWEARRDSFSHLGHSLYNLIFEKRSNVPNAGWLFISAHYDSKNGAGVNDNGSGLVACMEIARALSDIPLRRNVRIIHFSSEEFNLTGSRHYVNEVLAEKPDEVLLVFNLDQLGGTLGATDNHKIYTERDEDLPLGNNQLSDSLTDILGTIVREYSSLEAVKSKAFASDYIPFQQAGYTINGLYQFSSYPFYHTENDLLINMDTEALQEVIRVALAYVLYLAAEDKYTLSTESHFFGEHIAAAYPNPTKDHLILPLETEYWCLFDREGRLLKEMQTGNSLKVDLKDLKAGCYILRMQHKGGEWFQNAILKVR